MRPELVLALSTFVATEAAAQKPSTSTISGLFSEEALLDFADLASEPPPAMDIMGPSWPRATAALRLETDLAVDTSFDRRGEMVAELWLRAELELRVELASQLSAYVAPKVSHVSALSREGDDRYFLYLEAPEASVTWVAGPFHLRAGTLIFGWGASDVVAPSDVLNPIDLRRGVLSVPRDLKIPVLAAEAVMAVGPVTLRAVVEPTFTPSRYFLYGWDTALAPVAQAFGVSPPDLEAVLGAGTVDRIADEASITGRPSAGPASPTLGLRATAQLLDLELSGTFVYGWDVMPTMHFDPSLLVIGHALLEASASHRPLDLLDSELLEAVGGVNRALAEGRSLYDASVQRRTLLGGDAVLALDPFVLKLDVAYTFARTLYTQDLGSVRRPWLSAVVGLEYVDGERLQILVEAFTFTIFDVRSWYRLLLLEPRAAPPSNLDVGGRTLTLPGVAAVVRTTFFEGDLAFELGAMGILTRGDFVLTPTIRWRLSDHHQVHLSGLLLEGRRDSYGGLYTSNDQLIAGYTWSL